MGAVHEGVDDVCAVVEAGKGFEGLERRAKNERREEDGGGEGGLVGGDEGPDGELAFFFGGAVGDVGVVLGARVGLRDGQPGCVGDGPGEEFVGRAGGEGVDRAGDGDGFEGGGGAVGGAEEGKVAGWWLVAGKGGGNGVKERVVLPVNGWSQIVTLVVGVGRVVKQGSGNMDDLRCGLRISVLRRKTRGGRAAHMVKAVLSKHLVPVALLGIILDHNEFEFVLPLRMQSKDLVDQVGTTDGADYIVACSDEGVDDVGSDEGVGAGEERGGHGRRWFLGCWVCCDCLRVLRCPETCDGEGVDLQAFDNAEAAPFIVP